MAITDHELDTGVSIGTQDLTGVTDIDPEEAEILGHAVTYTVGDFEVPREWLMERMEDMGLPEFMKFRQPTDKRAYNRIRQRLVNVDNGYDEIKATVEGETRKARVFTKKVTNESFQIDVDVFYDSDAENEQADWRTTTIGYVNYKSEDGGVITRPDIREEDPLYEIWMKYAGEVHEARSYYKTVHLGKEFQKLMGRVVKHWTEGVKIRSAGAVYFVPARHAETMEKLGRLFAEIDEKFKDSGSRLEVNTIPVLSDEQRQAMVAERAEEELEARVGEAIGTVEEEIEDSDTDDEEELVDELVDVFEGELEEIEDFTTEYNALLEAKLSIREVIKSRKGAVVPEVEEVLEEVGF